VKGQKKKKTGEGTDRSGMASNCFVGNAPALARRDAVGSRSVCLGGRLAVCQQHAAGARTCAPRRCARTVITCHAANEAPDFQRGWTPEQDTDYTEVRVFTVGHFDNQGGCMISLKPVENARQALRMQVVAAQAEAMQAALVTRKRRSMYSPVFPDDPRGLGNAGGIGANGMQHEARRPTQPAAGELDQCSAMQPRPTTHDLIRSMLDASMVVVTKAAITHYAQDVYIARVWFRAGGLGDGEISVDARPSDAITMALSNQAPIFLNNNLLIANGSDLSALEREIRRGYAKEIVYDDIKKSTRSLVIELKRRPEHIELSKLKMQLDMAVRTERFHEAAHLHRQIQKICPLDELRELLDDALRCERFEEAAQIRDEIYQWRLKLIRWELDA